jgi:hypothetical protein
LTCLIHEEMIKIRRELSGITTFKSGKNGLKLMAGELILTIGVSIRFWNVLLGRNITAVSTSGFTKNSLAQIGYLLNNRGERQD